MPASLLLKEELENHIPDDRVNSVDEGPEVPDLAGSPFKGPKEKAKINPCNLTSAVVPYWDLKLGISYSYSDRRCADNDGKINDAYDAYTRVTRVVETTNVRYGRE